MHACNSFHVASAFCVFFNYQSVGLAEGFCFITMIQRLTPVKEILRVFARCINLMMINIKQYCYPLH